MMNINQRATITELWQFKAHKVKNKDIAFILQAWLMANRFFRMRQRMVPFSAETNGE